jgi:hypothetical protein
VAARFTVVPKRLPISMLTLHSIMRGAIAIARTATPAPGDQTQSAPSPPDC